MKGLRFIKTLEKCLKQNRKLFIKKLIKAHNKYYHYIKHDSVYIARFLTCVAEANTRGYL